eukprot:INCI15803.5.p1 GENE.INCI15803.5~~INCI15803.5.p1  ORF type:complete len:139 (-),score=12.97 INCI15803.5:215-631(-)
MWAVTFLYFLFFSLSTVDRHIIGFFSVFVWRWNKGGSTAQPTQRSRFRTAVASKAVSLTSPNRYEVACCSWTWQVTRMFACLGLLTCCLILKATNISANCYFTVLATLIGLGQLGSLRIQFAQQCSDVPVAGSSFLLG